MKSTVKGSIKLLLIFFIISLLVCMFSNLRIDFYYYVFVYFFLFFVLPDWFRNNNINWGMKLCLTISFSIISIATIRYIYGTSRPSHSYTILFCVVIIYLIAENCIKKYIKGKS